MLKKIYLTVEVGSVVYLVYESKREGAKQNTVIQCKVNKATVYEDTVIYCCEIIKFVTKNKTIAKGMELTFMFQNANVDTGYRNGINRYPVFTTKEKCIKWLKG